MSDIYNFSAGPAVLPRAVLEQARDELLDWHGSGMSVMEMSHRSKEYLSIAEQAEADLRELLSIADNHRVLFLQGGATSQFCMVPMNLLRGKQQADYVNTGAWSKKAIAEAQRYCDVNVVASSEDTGFSSIPAFDSWQLNKDAAYLQRMPPTCTTRRMKPSVVSSFTGFLTVAMCRWSRTCPRPSCHVRWMCRAMA